MTGTVAGVDFLGLLLAERLRRERGAGATARLLLRSATVWIVRRPSRRAHKRSRLERLGAPSVQLLAILGSWVRL